MGYGSSTFSAARAFSFMTLRPPRVKSEKSPLWGFLDYLVKWVTSERVLQIVGFTVAEGPSGKVFTPPPAKPGGTGTFSWQKPNRELDPTKPVTKDTFVYISPGNPIAATGLVDLVSNATTTSRPGIWQALKDIPAKTSAGKYHVPQTPYPTNGGTGDADATNNYWILWSPTPYC